MQLTNTFLTLLLTAGASAQRTRWRTSNNPAPTPAPTPTPPPPPRGSTQSMWGQCGGRDWEYATACVSDAYCYNDGENEWYSQCIPLENEDSPPLNQDPDVETRILTTIFDVPGPTPTVVTTYITIYTSVEPVPSPPPPQPPVTITVIPDTPIHPKQRRWEA
ncbi:hypothetical protein jhhlp_004758 [Lomentospora prolificans]|uniref:CBM1 domain-containing protein n=1 Tax=Lomentospora prolificans TaxID=41688 RepID=A0A2N3N8F6_9PEZI|nr:hypothetical protein jhhlp_004758 [Lomentospora prolificans]